MSKRYRPSQAIVPIGCDCHPAYMLKSLNLREQSLPFDWLDTQPLYGIKYVYENIINKFEFFLSDLKKNKEDKVFAEKYECSTFYHYNDLIKNNELQSKLRKRCADFLKLIKKEPIYFINTVTSDSINSNEAIQTFLNSINEFLSILKRKDLLLIYLRYDESLEENKLFCDELISKVSMLHKNVKIINYIREKENFGIWGDEKKYSALIKRIGINLYPIFPKTTFSRIFND